MIQDKINNLRNVCAKITKSEQAQIENAETIINKSENLIKSLRERSDLLKAKAKPVGTISTHGGKKVRKQADGSWQPVKGEGKSSLKDQIDEHQKALNKVREQQREIGSKKEEHRNKINELFRKNKDTESEEFKEAHRQYKKHDRKNKSLYKKEEELEKKHSELKNQAMQEKIPLVKDINKVVSDIEKETGYELRQSDFSDFKGGYEMLDYYRNGYLNQKQAEKFYDQVKQVYKKVMDAKKRREDQSKLDKEWKGSDYKEMSISAMKALSEQKGSHFFSKDTMKFFASKVHTGPNEDGFFITSEKSGFNDPTRKYTVRRFNVRNGDIHTIGNVGEFNGLNGAKDFIKSGKAHEVHANKMEERGIPLKDIDKKPKGKDGGYSSVNSLEHEKDSEFAKAEAELNSGEETEADDLQMYIENDGDLYRQRHSPIMENLKKKMAKGDYDHNQAAKLFMNLVDVGSKKYAKEEGEFGHMYDTKVRKAVAKKLADTFLSEVKNQEHDIEYKDGVKPIHEHK